METICFLPNQRLILIIFAVVLAVNAAVSDEKDKTKAAQAESITSCQDSYNSGNTQSGIHTLEINSQTFQVYCLFVNQTYGYIFPGRNAVAMVPLNITQLSTDTSHVLLLQRLTNGDTTQTILEQLDAYAHIDLSYFHNAWGSFNPPSNRGTFGGEFLYVGFLNISTYLETIPAARGFTSNNADMMHVDGGDQNANSQCTFFANLAGTAGCIMNSHQISIPTWLSTLTTSSYPDVMADSDYWFTMEIHMGGDGVYYASAGCPDVQGYAAGLPFSLVCSDSPCLNGGTCVVTSTDTYKCKCTPYFIGETCGTEAVTNVARYACGASCTASSTAYYSGETRHCYHCIDDGSVLDNFWASDNERVGAWYRVHLTDYYRIHSIALFNGCSDDVTPSSLNMSTSDLRITEVEAMCIGATGCETKFWEEFDILPTVTDYLHLEVTGTCAESTDNFVAITGIQVYGNNVPLMNAASLAAGATCTASTAYHQEDFGCQNAIDEVDSPGAGNEWMSNGEGAGAWIQINLNHTSTVMSVGFLQRCSQLTQNKFLMLEFSDDSPQDIELECFTTGQDPLDCDGQYWQQFDLDPYVVTSFVRVTITSVCAAENNGFREIRVFSLREEGNY